MDKRQEELEQGIKELIKHKSSIETKLINDEFGFELRENRVLLVKPETLTSLLISLLADSGLGWRTNTHFFPNTIFKSNYRVYDGVKVPPKLEHSKFIPIVEKEQSNED